MLDNNNYNQQHMHDDQQCDGLLGDFNPFCQHAILRAKDQNICGWLSALPLVKNHLIWLFKSLGMLLPFDTRNPCSGKPKSCDDCDAEFTIKHTLDCRFGGLVSCHHNEIYDAIGGLASLLWGNVVCEPVICDKLTSSDGA